MDGGTRGRDAATGEGRGDSGTGRGDSGTGRGDAGTRRLGDTETGRLGEPGTRKWKLRGGGELMNQQKNLFSESPRHRVTVLQRPRVPASPRRRDAASPR